MNNRNAIDGRFDESRIANCMPSKLQPSATVSEVCNWIAEIWPERFKWTVVTGDTAMKESKLLQLDSRKAADVLGWRPRMSSHDAVGESIAWYKAFHSGRNPFDLCSQQIEHRLAPLHSSI